MVKSAFDPKFPQKLFWKFKELKASKFLIGERNLLKIFRWKISRCLCQVYEILDVKKCLVYFIPSWIHFKEAKCRLKFSSKYFIFCGMHLLIGKKFQNPRWQKMNVNCFVFVSHLNAISSVKFFFALTADKRYNF